MTTPVVWLAADGQGDTLGHPPRRDHRAVLTRTTDDEDADLVGVPGHRERGFGCDQLHPFVPRAFLEVTVEHARRHARGVEQVAGDVTAIHPPPGEDVRVLRAETDEELRTDARVVHA